MVYCVTVESYSCIPHDMGGMKRLTVPVYHAATNDAPQGGGEMVHEV